MARLRRKDVGDSKKRNHKRFKPEGWEFNVSCPLCKKNMEPLYEERVNNGFVITKRWFKCIFCKEEFRENIWKLGSNYKTLLCKKADDDGVKSKYIPAIIEEDEKPLIWGGSYHELNVDDKVIASIDIFDCWEANWKVFLPIHKDTVGSVISVFAEEEDFENGILHIVVKFGRQEFSFTYPDKLKRVRPLIRSRRRKRKNN